MGSPLVYVVPLALAKHLFFDIVNNVAFHLNRLDFYSRFICKASIDRCGCVLFVSENFF